MNWLEEYNRIRENEAKKKAEEIKRKQTVSRETQSQVGMTSTDLQQGFGITIKPSSIAEAPMQTVGRLDNEPAPYQKSGWISALLGSDTAADLKSRNMEIINSNTQLLSSTQMDGTNHSILEEMQQISQMENGKEKDKRKSAVLKKMDEIGVPSRDYGLYVNDSNVTAGNVLNFAKNAAASGLASFNKGLTSTADLILGKPLQYAGWEHNPISQLAEGYADQYEQQRYLTQLAQERMGGGAGLNFAGQAIEGTVGALPDALIALFTGGMSEANTSANLASKAAYEVSGVLKQFGITAEQMMRNPAYWTSFAREYGSDYEEAKQMGASDTAAAFGSTITALLNSGIEIGTDGLSGIQGLPQEAKQGGSKLLKWLTSSIDEGKEEGAQKLVSEVISKAMYNKDADILNPGEYLQEMALGAISGLALGGGQIAVDSAVNKAGQAIQTAQENKLSDVEQKVVDSVVESRTTEDMTAKQKANLRKEVVEEMKKGYIPIDEIEKALGGKEYDAYKSEVDSRKALQDEFDELGKKQNATLAEQDRYNELKDQISKNKDTDTTGELKNKLSAFVYEQAQGSRLAESYAEQGRRGQHFEADVSKYSEAQQQTIQSAIESGVLNNTRRTHDLVDFIAKISEDTGRPFSFTNNEAIQNSSFAVKNAIVDAYVTKDGITLNVESPKYLNAVVGHEVTHVLEGSELYQELADTIIEYAKSKGDYDSRIEKLTKLYQNVEGADINAELVADLVGDYLFTDKDFVRKLSTEHQNVFQKVYSWIKRACKMATAGSKEARQLEKVRQAFEDAYRSGKTNQSTDADYSLSSIANSFFGNENMTSSEFTEQDYRHTQGYKDYVEQCLNNYRQTRPNFDEAAARAEIEYQIDGIVKVAVASAKAGYNIMDDASRRNVRDSKKRLLFSSLEPNSDYFTSSDISTICDKRKNFSQIYEDIVRAEEAKGIPAGKRFFDNVDNFFYLHKVMADKGLTQPCRQCYVESMRKNLAPMASAFLRLVKETDVNNLRNDQLYQQKGKTKGTLKTNNAKLRENVISTLGEYGMTVEDLSVETLTTEDGLARLKIQAPLIYEAFNSFYGQSKPKMPKSATPFRFGELTALLTDEHGKIKQSLVDKINSTGGFRLQSYSDFQIQNWTDVLQVIFEAGTLGLNGHAYTKVPAFLDATADTNLKRNISVFMYKDGSEWKIDRNDSFPYTLDEIYDIVRADKNGNTGIIVVSQNDDNSAWIMANDMVGYGIPFHKSGNKMGTVRDTIVREDGREIKGYQGTKDHTKQQTEVWARAGEDHKALTKVKNGINIYTFWDFDNKANLSHNELIEKNVKAYIDQCEMAGYLPKFRDYVMNNEKVLNAVLKYSKELGYADQNATVDDISFRYKGFTIPYGYYKFLGDFGMFKPDGTASSHKTLSLNDYNFDKAVQTFESSETLKRNEILQQFSNGEEREKYRNSDYNAEELNDIVNQKRREVAQDVLKGIYGEDFAPTYSLSDDSENSILNIEGQLEDLNNQILLADVNGITRAEKNALVSQQWKLENELDQYVAQERRKGVKTSIGEIQDNLENYRFIDLRSLANQMFEETEGLTTREDYIKAINDYIEEVKGDLEEDEIYQRRFGYFVRPITETGGRSNIIQFQPNRYSLSEGYYARTNSAEYGYMPFTDSAEERSNTLKKVMNSDIVDYYSRKHPDANALEVLSQNTWADYNIRAMVQPNETIGEFVKRYNENPNMEVPDAITPAINSARTYGRDGRTYINVHELSVQNARRAAEFGLVNPSVGIVDVDNPTTHFGDVSIVFKSDAFMNDAEMQPTFAGDAYSESFPQQAMFASDFDMFLEYKDVLGAEETSKVLNELRDIGILQEGSRTSGANRITFDSKEALQEIKNRVGNDTLQKMMLHDKETGNYTGNGSIDDYVQYIANTWFNNPYVFDQRKRDDVSKGWYDSYPKSAFISQYDQDAISESMRDDSYWDAEKAPISNARRFRTPADLMQNASRNELNQKVSQPYYEIAVQRPVSLEDEVAFIVAPASAKEQLDGWFYAPTFYYDDTSNVDNQKANAKKDLIQQIFSQADYDDVRYSLSDEHPVNYGTGIRGEDVRYEEPEMEDIAPVEEQEAPIQEQWPEQPAEERNRYAMYNTRDSENGWGEAYDNAHDALEDAVENISTDLWNAVHEEGAPNSYYSTRRQQAFDRAFSAVEYYVENDVISPAQGAMLLRDVYDHGGVGGLARMYTKKGGLYANYIRQAQHYDSVPNQMMMQEDIAPVQQNEAPMEQESLFDEEPIPQEQQEEELPDRDRPTGARVRTEATVPTQRKSKLANQLVSQLVDKGMVFENLALKTGNMELQAKYDYQLPTKIRARAQYFMQNGRNGVRSLKSIIDTVNESGKLQDFQDYMYHRHNADRMNLATRYGIPNKPVFGDHVTSEQSTKIADDLLMRNPEFEGWASDVYAVNRQLRGMLLEQGIIDQRTYDLWEQMYPHYVPINRADERGRIVGDGFDQRRMGINAPIKRATGGNTDIEPLFNTMAQRIEQTFRAVAKNSFGLELMRTLDSVIDTEDFSSTDPDNIEQMNQREDSILGEDNGRATYTVFQNGRRTRFEISNEMYDALQPAKGILGSRIAALNKFNNFRRNLLTQYNAVFSLYRNPVKDLQELGLNSQHPLKTYATIPEAIMQLATNGNYAQEYAENGGESNSYYDSRFNQFAEEDSKLKKIIGMPLHAIETAGEFIETVPRLSEYIASRKEGRTIERSMLDSARVTTNFAAGGDFTKFLNGNGATFLNASVQGMSQHVRNFREATKLDGVKGFVKTAAKYIMAGIPGILLNSLLWDDDDDYQDLSDYVKENYYIVAKTNDGKFIRIPKGRTAAVVQYGLEQMQNLATGNDEADFEEFFKLFMDNIAPNNPIENNIVAPIFQAYNNEAWYGGDLVPARLQNLPAAEQFDESTDSFSKWLGEKTNISPYKINYLIDQYSGGLGDIFLPMMTPKAESGDTSAIGKVLAPWKKEMTTDYTINNQNPSDFFDLRDKVEGKASSMNATDEEKMQNEYLSAVSWDVSDLYKQKRVVQNSDLPDDKKFAQVRELQRQINELTKNAVNSYQDVNIDGAYAEVGDKRFNYSEDNDKWYQIRETNSDGTPNKMYQKEQEVVNGLGITPAEYWNKRAEYNFAYDKPDQYALAKACGGYETYTAYTKALGEIKADKDAEGKSISGSRKAKIIDYINNLNTDYSTKIMLYKREYNSDNSYNNEIIEYLNGRDDISYTEMEGILKYLGFKVDVDGNISW